MLVLISVLCFISVSVSLLTLGVLLPTVSDVTGFRRER